MSKDECKKLNKNEWKKWVSVLGRMLLAYALVFAQGAWATQNQATKDKPGSPQKAAVQQAAEKQSSPAASAMPQSKQAKGEESENAVAEEKPSNDASHQGIKVHGHWTIEVRNPDGGLVTHTEFENSLAVGQPGGAGLISALLARQASAGGWAIFIFGTNTGPCAIAGTNAPSVCQLYESGIAAGPGSGGFVFNTLAPPTVDSNSRLVLSGQATAAISDSITVVTTLLMECPNTVAPATPCQYQPSTAGFTAARASSSNPGFSAPIPVQPNQIIQVQVVISFS